MPTDLEILRLMESNRIQTATFNRHNSIEHKPYLWHL